MMIRSFLIGITFILAINCYGQNYLDSVYFKRRTLFSDTVGLDKTSMFTSSNSEKPIEILRKAIAVPLSVTVLNMYLDEECVSYLDSINWPFDKFTNLKSLALGGITAVQWMTVLNKVKDLEHLSHLSSPNVPIPAIKSLKTLELGVIDSPVQPEIFWNNPSLQYVSIHGCSEIPNSIGNLQHLNFLLIQGRLLESLPDSICNLNSLVYLTINAPKLTGLPECFGNLNGLIELTIMSEISNANFTRLPASFAQLNMLRRLGIYYANFEHFPDVICQLKNIEEIRIDVNNVRYIPNDIGNLTSLKLLIIKTRGAKNSKTMKRTVKKIRRLLPGTGVDVSR